MSWISDDGKEWDTKDDCLGWMRIAPLMRLLLEPESSTTKDHKKLGDWNTEPESSTTKDHKKFGDWNIERLREVQIYKLYKLLIDSSKAEHWIIQKDDEATVCFKEKDALFCKPETIWKHRKQLYQLTDLLVLAEDSKCHISPDVVSRLSFEENQYFVPAFYMAEHGPEFYEESGETRDDEIQYIEDQIVPGFKGRCEDNEYLIFDNLENAKNYVRNRMFYISNWMSKNDMYWDTGMTNQISYGDIVLIEKDFCWEGGDSRVYQTPDVEEKLCSPGFAQLLRFAIGRTTPERRQKMQAIFNRLPVDIQNTPPAHP